MSRSRRDVVSVLLLCLLSACASAPPPEPAQIDAQRRAEFDKSLLQWHGASVQELRARLGAPTAISRPTKGILVHVYVRSLKGSSDAMVRFVCVVRYSIDERSKRVIGHDIEGC